eukprot:11949670-Alexandrium_andersonii.AAC.1
MQVGEHPKYPSSTFQRSDAGSGRIVARARRQQTARSPPASASKMRCEAGVVCSTKEDSVKTRKW